MKTVILILSLFVTCGLHAQTCYETPWDKFVYNPNLIANGNTTICFGQQVEIATIGLGQKWCANGFTLTNGRSIVQPTQTTLYSLYSIRESGNRVVNGDFSLGDTLFKSDYPNNIFDIYLEGDYNVSPDPTLTHLSTHKTRDHTSGAGNMMNVNGAQYPHRRVWYQTIAVARNQVYNCTFWANNINADPGAKLHIEVDGVPVNQNTLVWEQKWIPISADINTGNRDSITLCIVDDELVSGNNDFAIDDISLTTVFYEFDVLQIEVNPAPKTIVDTIRTCRGSSGVSIDTLRSGPCDTLYKKHVTIVTLDLGVETVCKWYGCKSYTLNGITYTKSTTVRDTLKSQYGCDSLYRTNIITIGMLIAAIHADTTIQSCTFVRYKNWLYTEPYNLIKDTVFAAGGCDSIYNVIRIQISPPPVVINRTLMDCRQVGFEGKTYTSGTILKDTLRGSFGCDSIYRIITIIVGKPVTIMRDTTIVCNQISTHSDTTKSRLGCDSLINFHYYKVDQATIRVALNKTICSGDTYTMPRGTHINATGTYMDTIRYAAGCDSLITQVNLIVLPFYNFDLKIKICPGGYAVLPYNDTVRSVGTYDTLIRYVKTGCDSLRSHIEVSEMRTATVAEDVQVCDKSYKLPSGQLVTTPGVYYQVLKSKQGCDSLVKKFNVFFKVKNARLLKSNDVNCTKSFADLIVNTTGTITWSNGTHGNKITVAPNETTTYKVTVSENGCNYQDSITVFATKDGADNIEVPTAFTPNGDGLNDCYSVKVLGAQNFQLSIYNRWGQMVWQTTDPSRCWDGTYKGKPQDAAAFVYQLAYNGLCGRVYKKGTIVLIR